MYAIIILAFSPLGNAAREPITPCTNPKEEFMLEIAAAIAIFLVVFWIARAVFLDDRQRKIQPTAPSIYPSYQ